MNVRQAAVNVAQILDERFVGVQQRLHKQRSTIFDLKAQIRDLNTKLNSFLKGRSNESIFADCINAAIQEADLRKFTREAHEDMKF